jgi:hypothetical protein
MTVSMTRYYRLRVLPAGELRRALRAIISATATVDVSYDLADGSLRREQDVSDDDLRLVCDLSRDRVEAFGEVHLALDARDDALRVRVSADTSRRVCEVFEWLERALHLEELPAEPPERRAPSREKRRMRCFLSYRFDAETVKIALDLKRFLDLLDVEVITASATDPGTLGEHVLENVDRDRDFIALVVSAGGESPWTRDEIARARTCGARVVPVIQEAAPDGDGTFGGLECISFAPGRSRDAFSRLLETVRSIASAAAPD